MDKRHQRRVELVQELFALGFEKTQPAFVKTLADKQKALKSEASTFHQIKKKLAQIDEMIKTYASRYPIEKIAKTDLAILRLSIYELVFEKKNPPKVVIDEAVILAKEFGNENSYSFVNGVLGSIMNKEL